MTITSRAPKPKAESMIQRLRRLARAGDDPFGGLQRGDIIYEPAEYRELRRLVDLSSRENKAIPSIVRRKPSSGDGMGKNKETGYDSDVPLPKIPIPPRAIKTEEMVVDPDSDSSSLCTACTIPIFSTPSIRITHEGEQLFLHEQCATMPEKLLHELHPEHALLLLNHLHDLPTPPMTTTTTTTNCSNCKNVCGTMFYECPCPDCDFRLDLMCASQIKIVHKSHHHSMMVLRLRDYASLTCSACDNKHGSSSSSSSSSELATLSYMCNLCGYWIHPDCASLPNAIVNYEHHHHSLFLTYNLQTTSDSKCVICDNILKKTYGVYTCLKCYDYAVHIRCALTHPETFKSVFIRDAEVSDLARLPMPDENTSLIPYLRSRSGDDRNQEELHQHSLTLHEAGVGERSISGVCNACVQFVSPPFFGCSECPEFFLHTSCAHLPSKIDHRVHKHPLYLFSIAPKSDVSRSFDCKGCGVRCNGYAYSCKSCNDDYKMDVACAILNPAITHDSHEKTHILFMSREADNFGSYQICNCCSYALSGICYECNICPKFKLHVRCALLPITVSHSFDKHPLQLITTAAKKKNSIATDDDTEICEVCEEQMEKKKWHYSCEECDQSFHIDCIPAVDRLSRIKLGSTISVSGHGCPLMLVREEEAVCLGRRCGVCGAVLKSSDAGLAYECPKCFFGIHYTCAE